MDPITYKIALAAAGAGDAVPTADFVDEVFQSDLYHAFSSTDTTLQNGPDFAGDGGLVWIKGRDVNNNHCLFDTERGVNKFIRTNSADPEATSSGSLKAFNSNGVTIGGGNSNISSVDTQYLAFQFRRCKGFFDVVKYTGNGSSSQQIEHSLGSVPGCIIIKNIDVGYGWVVGHRDGYYGGGWEYSTDFSQDGFGVNATTFNDTDPTSTHFTVGSQAGVNANGNEFIAYIFAHDEQIFGSSNNESIIKCGSYNGNNSTQIINLGWEPQWVLLRPDTFNQDWHIFDRKTGMSNWDRDAWSTHPNTNNTRAKVGRMMFNSQGFQFYNENSVAMNANGYGYIYVAIRAPHKVPTSGTDVFTSYTFVGNGTNLRRATMPSSATTDTDLIITKVRDTDGDWMWGDRILDSDTAISRLTEYLRSNVNNPRIDVSGGYYTYASDGEPAVGTDTRFNKNGVTTLVNAFKRAPGFFDIVPYRGTGSNQYLYHNLGVKPEWIFVKRQSGLQNWAVYTDDTGAGARGRLNDNSQFSSTSTYWLSPNAALFGVKTDNDVNRNGDHYMAYLFADCTGVCKTTFYTGNGGSKFINCGFQPRFLMFKTQNSSGDWLLWCSGLGITTYADQYNMFNEKTNVTPSQNMVNVSSSGLNIQSAGASLLNASGTNYLLLAIA